MKKFLEELKGARKIEWFLLIAAVAALFLSGLDNSDDKASLRTESERRLISVLQSIDGIGTVDAMIVENNAESRVLIIAEGVEDVGVYLNIQRAVQTLCDIELSSIEIVPHES